jgi:hypothetical protein
MRAVIAVFALIGLCTLGVAAATVTDVTLQLTRALRPGDQLNVAVSVGPIGRNRIEVTTAEGQRLGTISLFGVPPGRAGGTYLIPVPPEAVRNGQLDLRFTISSGGEQRSPTTEEVTGVRLVLPGE